MLKSLEELQNRAEQKDPIKAKQKLRYIVGLKQVRIRVIFVASYYTLSELC